MIIVDDYIDITGVSVVLVLISLSFYNSITLLKDFNIRPDIHMKALIWGQGIVGAVLIVTWLYLFITLLI